MIEVLRVVPGTLAAELGLEPGDRIVSINRGEVHDIIDFTFFSADERLTIVVQKKKSGKNLQVKVRRVLGEDLGLEFGPLRVKRCRNRCLFCFVDQMPKGCRPSLYVKDDDYRASFLYGNYITLGNLTSYDWERIIRQRLSPLFISVHATDPKVRSLLLGNPSAPDILTGLKTFAAAGIKIHAQIVLCPGINDGSHFIKTVEDLAALYPAVLSIAAVPVGLTSRRKNLFPLKQYSSREARLLIQTVHEFQIRFKRQFGTKLVFAADEFYIKAGAPFPSASFYEDFFQKENGIGMVAAFIRRTNRIRLPEKITARRVTVVTGASFGKILKSLLNRLTSKHKQVRIKLVTVPNLFFGHSVTVAGLLTGSDILNALKGRRLGDVVVIPANALKEDEDIFLDGMRLDELELALGVKVVKAETMNTVINQFRTGRK